MKQRLVKFLIQAAVAVSAVFSFSAVAADVGVSISVGQPGFYGQIDIGNFPRPQLVYAQPLVIRPPVGIVYEPIYLNVPPGQAKKWGYYCGRYNACGRPVYFVQNRWYNDVYVPEYRNRHGGKHDRDYGHDSDHGWDDRDHGHKGHGKNDHGGHGGGHGKGNH